MEWYAGLEDRIEKELDTVQSDFTFNMHEDSQSWWILFEAYSPAGEDVCLEGQFMKDEHERITMEDVVEFVRGEAESFDPDDHAAMWIPLRGTRGVPDDVLTLAEDAREIDLMIQRLYETVKSA